MIPLHFSKSKFLHLKMSMILLLDVTTLLFSAQEHPWVCIDIRRGEVEGVWMERERVGGKTGSGCLRIPGNRRSALFEA